MIKMYVCGLTTAVAVREITFEKSSSQLNETTEISTRNFYKKKKLPSSRELNLMDSSFPQENTNLNRQGKIQKRICSRLYYSNQSERKVHDALSIQIEREIIVTNSFASYYASWLSSLLIEKKRMKHKVLFMFICQDFAMEVNLLTFLQREKETNKFYLLFLI